MVIDRFDAPSESATVLEETPAIVGVDGQTFINGFLSDTFVDTDSGVELVKQQMEYLLEGASDPANVLFYIDSARGTDVYARALDDLVSESRILLNSASSSDFATAIEAGGWDLIISATQDGSAAATHDYDAPLAEWICSGGKAIISDFRVDSAGAESVLACSETGFSTLYNFEEMESDGGLFEGTLGLYNPGWGYFSVALEAGTATRFAYTHVEVAIPTGLKPNALGHTPEHSGIDTAESEWMLNDSRGVYHPNWGTTLSWSSSDGHYRQILGADTGLDISQHQALGFRIMQRHDDSRNSDEPVDLTLRLTDQLGNAASVPLSTATQGALRPNPAVGAGTNAKSVYETYRLPLSAFTDNNPDLQLENMLWVDWIFDRTSTGSVTIDDVVFAHAGLCD